MSLLQQGSKEWLDMRKKYIGASDAPAIMQVSPWKTQYSLWMEKVSNKTENKTSVAMKRGTELEEPARKCFENKTGLVMFPRVKFHDSINYMMASLDGMDIEEKNIVEIKCPGFSDHQTAINGKVPEKYLPQLMHQLEVCQLEKAYYFSYDGNDGVILEVYRDDKYIKNLLKEEKEFWDHVENFIAPPLTEKDYILKEEEEWLSKAKKWLMIKEKLSSLEKEEDELRKSLILMCEEKNCIGGGISLTKRKRKGNVDYKCIPELENKNLDIYRKDTVEFWQLEAC